MILMDFNPDQEEGGAGSLADRSLPAGKSAFELQVWMCRSSHQAFRSSRSISPPGLIRVSVFSPAESVRVPLGALQPLCGETRSGEPR